MKKLLKINIACLLAISAILPSCKKEIGSLNGASIEEITKNATKQQLDNVVTGTEAGMRGTLETYFDVVGVIGREMYRFAGSEPRYTRDLLGKGSIALDNNTFYLTNPWNARYRVVKDCNILIQAANNSTFITAEEKKGYIGFAKTIKAYQLLLNLNLTYDNGIRVDVDNLDNIGPFLNYQDALTAIAGILDEGKTDLTGATIAFPLSDGMKLRLPDGTVDPTGLIKLNRAIAARVAVYRKQWPAALTALNESFFDLNGNFNRGFFHSYSTAPNDQLNLMFVGQNQNGEIRIAHPSYSADIVGSDDRIGKATPRTSAASFEDLSSNRDVWIFTTNTAPTPIIRNEELILIYAEAKIQTTAIPDAIVALNRIRTGHTLPAYAGGITTDALITELLYNRRYSLYFEGHRWIDVRRYEKLNTLPIDRPGDDVWKQFPRPQTEL